MSGNLDFFSEKGSSTPHSSDAWPDKDHSLSFPISFSSVLASLGGGALKFVLSIKAKS